MQVGSLLPSLSPLGKSHLANKILVCHVSDIKILIRLRYLFSIFSSVLGGGV